MGTKKKTLAMEVQIVLVKTAHLTTKKMKTQAKQARARASMGTSMQTTIAARTVWMKMMTPTPVCPPSCVLNINRLSCAEPVANWQMYLSNLFCQSE